MLKTDARHVATSIVLRAAWQPQLFFSVIWFGLGLSMAIKGVLSHREDLMSGSLILVALGLGYVLWFRAFRLELGEAILVYRAPLSRTISISVNNIQQITTHRIVLSSKIKSVGYQRILIASKSNSPASFAINARVFPESESISLLDELVRRGVPVIRT